MDRGHMDWNWGSLQLPQQQRWQRHRRHLWFEGHFLNRIFPEIDWEDIPDLPFLWNKNLFVAWKFGQVFKFSLKPLVARGTGIFHGDFSPLEVRWKASRVCGAEERWELLDDPSIEIREEMGGLWLVTVRKLEMAGTNLLLFWGRVELEAPTSASHSTFCCVAWERTDCTAIAIHLWKLSTDGDDRWSIQKIVSKEHGFDSFTASGVFETPTCKVSWCSFAVRAFLFSYIFIGFTAVLLFH